MKINISILTLLVFVLSGCSSIISNSDYPVAINSSPDGAFFVIENRAGQKVHSGNTPSTVTLSSSAGYFKGEAYTVTLKKEGYGAKVYTINSSIDGWYFGNLLFGGVIGMLIVDPATGAMYNLPDRVDVSLDQQGASASLDTLKITTIDTLNYEQRSKLVLIK
jgi:hypothetical protein